MFWAPCGSGGGGGWVEGDWGVVGGASTHVHTHMHAHTRTHGKHDNFMQMAASIGFLGNPWEFPMMSYMHAHACMCMHMRACVCVCTCVGGTLSPPHPHPPTPLPPGGTLGISQKSIVLELIEIFQFCLKI